MKLKEILIRAAKTAVQSAVAAIGTASIFSVDWKTVVSIAVMSGVASIVNNGAVNQIAGAENEKTVDEIAEEMVTADMADAAKAKSEKAEG